MSTQELSAIGYDNKSPKFNGNNYAWWKNRIQNVIMGIDYECWLVVKNGPNIILKTDVEGNQVPKKDSELVIADYKLLEKNAKAMSILQQAIGYRLPTLVYLAREKRPQYLHNFKAGAMNSLLRVSSEISNGAVILNVDCDMYSNNSQSIRDALCFFMDEKKSQDIGFVQFPQNFENTTKNDIYGSTLQVISQVEFHGLDGLGGPLYVGTGCFHQREILCGRKYSKDYKIDWKTSKMDGTIFELEERAKSLASCVYELNSQWGKEVNVKN
uniref:Uncharacterized protein n=1 Tax=Chenopodium quinoa TaxID=63459 RepID=A0A803NBN4_CHEQI